VLTFGFNNGLVNNERQCEPNQCLAVLNSVPVGSCLNQKSETSPIFSLFWNVKLSFGHPMKRFIHTDTHLNSSNHNLILLHSIHYLFISILLTVYYRCQFFSIPLNKILYFGFSSILALSKCSVVHWEQSVVLRLFHALKSLS
jgi:hypothetical protein